MASLLSDEDPPEFVTPATGLGAMGRNLSIILSTLDISYAPVAYLAIQQPPLPSITLDLPLPKLSWKIEIKSKWLDKTVGKEYRGKEEGGFYREREKDTYERRQVVEEWEEQRREEIGGKRGNVAGREEGREGRDWAQREGQWEREECQMGGAKREARRLRATCNVYGLGSSL